MKEIFFTNTLENYLISFMNIFTDIYIKVMRDERVFIYEVPVVYGDFDKYSIARKYIEERGGNELSNYEGMPIISIKLTNQSFDKERDPLNKFKSNLSFSEQENKFMKSRMPIPVNYTFTVSIFNKYLNHYSQIIEQILPNFVRPYTIKVKEYHGINDINRSINITLENTDLGLSYTSDKSASDKNSYKELKTDLTFKLAGVLYFPIRNDDITLIEEINVKYFEDDKSKEEFGTQTSKYVSDYISYAEYLRNKDLIDNHGAFEATNSGGHKTINDYMDNEAYKSDNIDSLRNNIDEDFLKRLEKDY